ncbi:hypothetical protein ACFL6P_00125 [Candidatus Latescibacterota bacterium]
MTDDIKQLYTLYKNESCDFDRVKRLFLLLENVFGILKIDYSLNALEKEKDETVKLRFLSLLNSHLTQVHEYSDEISEMIKLLHKELADEVAGKNSKLEENRKNLSDLEAMKEQIDQMQQETAAIKDKLKNREETLTICQSKDKKLKKLREKLRKVEAACAEYNVNDLEKAIQEHKNLINEQEQLITEKKQLDQDIIETKEKNTHIFQEKENCQRILGQLVSSGDKSLAELAQVFESIKSEIVKIKDTEFIGNTVAEKLRSVLPELNILVDSVNKELSDYKTNFKETNDAWQGILDGNMKFAGQYKNEASEIKEEINKLLKQLHKLSRKVINVRDKA